MTVTHVIELTPVDRRGAYVCRYGGIELGRPCGSPVYQGCRELLKRGLAQPDDKVEARDSTGLVRMRGVVGAMAGKVVWENHEGMRAGKYRPRAPDTKRAEPVSIFD